MKQLRIMLIASCAAGVIEAVLFALFSACGRIGGDGPNLMGLLGLGLHLPGVLLADSLHLTGAADTALVVFIGFLQYFLLLWLAFFVWERRKRNGVS